MTPAQSIILFTHIDIISQGRFPLIKMQIAADRTSSPPNRTSITLSDAQGEAEAIYRFLAQVHQLSGQPRVSFQSNGTYTVIIDVPEEFKLDNSPEPEQLLAGYTAFLEEFRKEREDLAQLILSKTRELFPIHLRDSFPWERLIKWDEKLQCFSTPHTSVLQFMMKKLGINRMMNFQSRSNKHGLTSIIAKFPALTQLIDLRPCITQAQHYTEKDLADLAWYIKVNIERTLPTIRSDWLPTVAPLMHSQHCDALSAAVKDETDFETLIEVDLVKFSNEFDTLNELYYGKLEDYTRLVTAGSTPIGLCEAKGKRPAQEDYLAYDHDNVAAFPRLRPYDQWHTLIQTVESIKTQFETRTAMGTTLGSIIAWRDRCVKLVTTNLGDSSVLVVVIDPISNRIKYKRLLNNLHNPDENINPAEKNRVDAHCKAHNKPPSQNGRLESGLAMSRSLGDSSHASYGHLSIPEIHFDEIEVNEQDQVFIAVTCDGIFEPPGQTLDSVAQFLLQNYQNASLEQLASMLVNKAIQAGSEDNCSVAITKLGTEVISLSIWDGHGIVPGSHLLAHDGGKMFYPLLNKAIEAALAKQNNPQSPGWSIFLKPSTGSLPLESKIDFPQPDVEWNMRVVTHSHPSFPHPQREYAIQVAESNVPGFYSCRLHSFKEALSFFHFLTHLSCVNSNLSIIHNRAMNKYIILLNKQDYALLAPHMFLVKPNHDPKSKALIHPSLLVPHGIFSGQGGGNNHTVVPVASAAPAIVPVASAAPAVVPDASAASSPGPKGPIQ